MTKKALKIDIVSDVACPWCYVGKKHFEIALGNMEDLDLEVNWKPYQLEVDIKFKEMSRIPNTKKMHNLLHVASEKGFSNDLKEAFLEAYFEKSLDMTDDREVIAIAVKFGWTEEEAKAILDNEEISYRVNQEIRDVQNRGVSGVPFFILNDQYGISGAQPPEVLERWIRETGKETLVANENASCDVDDPNC